MNCTSHFREVLFIFIMKKQNTLLLLCLSVICLLSCNTGNKPEKQYGTDEITADEITVLTNSLIRHIAKMPDKASHESKFQSRYDDYYKNETARYELVFYGQNPKTGAEFFTYLRPAPSIHEKYVAVGGEIVRKNDEITQLTEHYRTWKMTREELMPKANLLFGKMLQGEDLTPYYPQNSGDEEYIQFPNESNYYSTEEKRWKSNDTYKSVYESL